MMEVSDDVLSTFVPVAVYWIFSGVYGLLARYMENHRLHPKGEEEVKNIASRGTVLKGVLLQQAIQILVVFSILKLLGTANGYDAETTTSSTPPTWLEVARQFVVGMVVLDTWQYFGHRYLHANKFLYRHLHATHHALVVPYAWGSLYNHPVEGLLMDTLGGSVAFLCSGMSTRTGIYFFSLATLKTLDVHCGLHLPWINPLEVIFRNNAAYHDIHHQLRGNKHNFAQPFFVSWDKILGTHMPFEVVKRHCEDGGGFEARPININNKNNNNKKL